MVAGFTSLFLQFPAILADDSAVHRCHEHRSGTALTHKSRGSSESS